MAKGHDFKFNVLKVHGKVLSVKCLRTEYRKMNIISLHEADYLGLKASTPVAIRSD